jgi:6-phosphogluconolactonase (cycloisomerase 2 family)
VLPEGAGCRHLDFHPNGKWVYVLCELDGNVVLCDWDTDAGVLSPRQSIYALPDGVVCSRAHHSGCSHILVSPDGANVYAVGFPPFFYDFNRKMQKLPLFSCILLRK